MSDILILPEHDELIRLEGLIHDDEGPRLAYLAARVPKDLAIVELGSYKGRSTCFLGAGSRAGNGAHVWAVDTWTSGTRTVKGYNRPRTFRTFRRQVSGMGLDDLVTWVRGESSQIGKVWTRETGLLFIDACHTEKSVRKDVTLWAPWVVPGGWIAFHDYGKPGLEGLTRVVDEDVAGSGEWEEIQVHRRLWTARRRDG